MGRTLWTGLTLLTLLAGFAGAEVNTTIDCIAYDGDGEETEFTFPFGIFSTAELRVVTRTEGVEAVQTLNSDYTLDDDDSDDDYWDGPGGTVTFTTAPASGSEVWISRAPPLTQTTDLDGSAYVRLSTLEDLVDKLVGHDQYLRGLLWRVPMIPETERQVYDMNLPAFTGTAGYLYQSTDGSWSRANPTAAGELTVTTSWSAVVAGDANGVERMAAKEDLTIDHVYDVRDYGAAGDRVTDDTEAIASAIDACCDAGGGTVFFPPGTYLVDSASIAALTNDALGNIDSDDVTIMGSGATIEVDGSDGVTIFRATGVNRLKILDLRVVGNSVGTASTAIGSFLYYQNTGATADSNDIVIENCVLENLKANGWISFIVEGAYDINDVRVKDCRFLSRTGNMPSTGDRGVAAACVRFSAAEGATGYTQNIEVSGCYCDCKYIKTGVSMRSKARRANIHDNTILDAGVDKATNSVQSYGIMAAYATGMDDINVYANRILNAWTCGIYAVSGSRLKIWGNHITGQVDTDDASLVTGGIALGSITDSQVFGNTLEDCAIGIAIQPKTLNSNIVAQNNTLTSCTTRGILIRENSTWQHAGGVSLIGNTLIESNLVIQRGSGATRLGNLTITGNTIHRGYIRNTQPIFGVVIHGNRILATDQGYGIYLAGGGCNLDIQNNQIFGPGASSSTTYGMYFGTGMYHPCVVKNNLISGWESGMYAGYAGAEFSGNTFVECETAVTNAVTGDLGRDAPSTIAGSVTQYWTAGTWVENAYPTSSPYTVGWKCVGPLPGRACTYTTTTTGDMTSGEYVISGVAAIDRYEPGVAITLANAAAGPATLSTYVVSWQIEVDDTTGFEAGEFIEGRTSHALGTIQSVDDGTTLQIVNHSWATGTYAVAETVAGHSSETTATITAVKLKVADACGNTVDDAALSLVLPTWQVVSAMDAANMESIAIVDLSNAQIKDLADTPVELVPAPGAGKWLEFCGASLWLDYGTNALTEADSPDDLRVAYTNDAGAAASADIVASGFITATADTGAFAIPVSVAGTAATSLVNQPLVLVNTGVDYGGNAANDTVLRVIVRYRVHSGLGL